MLYPGDTYQLLCSLTNADGSNPSVTSVPVVTVVRLRDLTSVVTAQAMTLITGTQKIYVYAWSTGSAEDGDYVAFVSYAADGVVVTSRFLERLRLGDSRVTGAVALDMTVAKDVTVAKDATVAKASAAALLPGLVTSMARVVQQVNLLPDRPANETTLETLSSVMQDVKDAQLGTWVIDKTVNPKVLTLQRIDGTTLAQYHLSEDASSATRLKF